MAARATELELDRERSPAEVQAQQLPLSMFNEDLVIEESLMRLITVRWSNRMIRVLFENGLNVQ